MSAAKIPATIATSFPFFSKNTCPFLRKAYVAGMKFSGSLKDNLEGVLTNFFKKEVYNDSMVRLIS
jgi:hypothetical protein